MTHDVLSAEFEQLIDRHAPVAQIATGFDFTEGPVWDPRDQALLFSDIPASVRRRWDERSGVREVRNPNNMGNGMTRDAQGALIICEHATSSVVRERPGGAQETLATHFEGQELNSPNDVVVKSDGSIWFTDPWYGRMERFGVPRERALGFQGVYRLPPEGGAPQLVVDRLLFDMPNGLCFSPDESKLYVNDTTKALIRVFDVEGARLANERLFASGIKSELKPGVPDGMKCDHQGNVWVTAPGGLWVYAPDGRRLGAVAIPEMAANLHWGGADWRTLFVTACTSVYAVKTKVGPRNEPFMRLGGAPNASTPPQAAPPSDSPAPAPAVAKDDDAGLTLDPSRCALILQDLQNDVMIDGGAFADTGAPQHAKDQNVIENCRRLAEVCRAKGVLVVHVWFLVEPGHPAMRMNAPLFEGLVDANALVRGTWGGAPAAGLEPQAGDLVVEKMQMSAWEGTRLETYLKGAQRDVIINCGSWTNMSVEHTARTGADKGYLIVTPEDACSTMNADWHRASIDYAMTNVARVSTVDDVLSALNAF
ncbi:MAG: isochorismatase family protein [Pseudomonadota bacterium]